MSRVSDIKKRWKADGKIAARDVDFLISEAQAAETMRAADKLRQAAGGVPGMDDFLSTIRGKS